MIADYLAASLLTLAVLVGCVCLICLVIWGYRAMRDRWLLFCVEEQRREQEARDRLEEQTNNYRRWQKAQSLRIARRLR